MVLRDLFFPGTLAVLDVPWVYRDAMKVLPLAYHRSGEAPCSCATLSVVSKVFLRNLISCHFRRCGSGDLTVAIEHLDTWMPR